MTWHGIHRRALLCLAVLGFAVLSPASRICAQIPDTSLWVPDGSYEGAVRVGGTLYVGGQFTRIGPPTGSAVLLDGATAQPAQPFPRFTGRINVIEPDGAGGWYVGGRFNGIDGAPRRNLAHVLANHTVSAWSPDPDSEVFALALQGGTLYVGGRFDHIGGATRHKLAALDAVTGSALAFDAGIPFPVCCVWPSVRAILATPTAVFVGGSFPSIGGQPRNGLAKLDPATGAVDATFQPAFQGNAHALVNAGASIYVGGSFNLSGAQPRTWLAELDAATGSPTAWNPVLDGPVNAMALDGPRLLVGGAFGLAGGVGRAWLAALDRGSAAALPFNAQLSNPSGFGSNVSGLSFGPGGELYVAGTFTHAAGVPHKGVVRLGSDGAAAAWDPDLNQMAGAVNASATGVLVGGSFSSVGGVARSNLAALDLTSGRPTNWAPAADGRVLTLLLDGGDLYAGGYFRHVSGAAHDYVARLDVGTGAVAAWDPIVNDVVSTIAVSGSSLYLGGYFYTVNTLPRFTLVRVDKASAAVLPFNYTPQGGPTNQILPDPGVGAVTVASQAGLFRLRESDGALLWNAGVQGAAYTVLQSGNTLYAGGSFFQVNGVPRSNLAAFDATTGALLPWNPGANGSVNGLVHDGEHLYAAGRFTQIGGVARTGYAVLDTSGSSVLPADVDLDGIGFRAVRLGASVLLSGLFTSVSHYACPGFALLPAAPPLGVGSAPVANRVRFTAAPMPSHARTLLRWLQPHAAAVDIVVHDAAGRLVAQPVRGEWHGAGAGEFTLRTEGWSPGVYLVTLRAGREHATGRVVVM